MTITTEDDPVTDGRADEHVGEIVELAAVTLEKLGHGGGRAVVLEQGRKPGCHPQPGGKVEAIPGPVGRRGDIELVQPAAHVARSSDAKADDTVGGSSRKRGLQRGDVRKRDRHGLLG